MSTNTQYRLVIGDAKQVEAQVNSLLAEGYTLQGGATFHPTTGQIAQAMTLTS